MVTLKRFLKDYRETGAFHELVNIQSALGEHTFATKAGQVFSVLKLGGIDAEGLDPAHIDGYCRRFETNLRTLEDCRIYQYLVKSNAGPIPARRYPKNPLLDCAVQTRVGFLDAKSTRLSEVSLYLAVVQDTRFNRARSFREALLTETRRAGDRKQIQTACEQLAQKIHRFSAQLADSAKPEWFGKDEAFRFLRYLVTFDPTKASARLKSDLYIDYQLGGSTLECHPGYLRLDDRYLKVLTLKDHPAHTTAHMLRDLLRIPAEFVVASEWKPVANDVVRRAIQSKRRHYHNKKTSPLAFAGSGSSAPADFLIDDSATAQVRSLGECLEEIEVRGNGFGHYSLSIVVHDLDPDRLKRSVGEFFKAFADHDAQLIEERYNVLNAYLAILPGGDPFNRRRMWLSSTNHADLSFIFRLDTGDETNRHLQAEYLALLETNDGTPYFLNLHYQDVGHVLVLGATGSGKSFTLNFLITSAQKYDPYICIFDIGGSYANLTRRFGGAYLSISAADWPFTINPFVLPPTAENLQFLLQLVLVLASSNGYAPTAADEKDLFEQIKNLYEIDPSQRRLSTLVPILSRALRNELEKWIRPGPYGALFDNAEDTLTFSRFQTFDFEGLVKSPMLEPFLFYILHRANTAILDPAECTTFKLFCLDEVWRFLQHPTIRQYVLEALKTWRKKNAAVILATQSTADLLQSEMLNVVVESCPTKLFLANPDMDRDAYRSIFHLTETEAELIANLVPKRQFLLKRPQLAKVLNLEVDPASYWLYTNDPYDQQKQRKAFEQYGFEEGLNTLARSPA